MGKNPIYSSAMRATIITLETSSRATKSANTQLQAMILRIMRPPARNSRSSNVVY
jgi:hypothetical protein